MMISQSNSLFFWILGFGVLTGLGLGFGYASATLIGFNYGTNLWMYMSECATNKGGPDLNFFSILDDFRSCEQLRKSFLTKKRERLAAAPFLKWNRIRSSATFYHLRLPLREV